jgi:hypothetical protein
VDEQRDQFLVQLASARVSSESSRPSNSTLKAVVQTPHHIGETTVLNPEAGEEPLVLSLDGFAPAACWKELSPDVVTGEDAGSEVA